MVIEREQLQAHAAFLRRVARAIVRNEHDADDVVQEAFSVALRAGGAPRGDLRGWLVGVVRNVARNRHRSEGRRRRREQLASAPEAVPGLDQTAARAETQRALASAVAGLPEPERATVLLRYFGQKSAAEIARRHGVTAKTVRVRLRRGLTRLREELQRRYGETAWIAPLVALAGLHRRAAAWTAGVAAVVLAACGIAFVFLAQRDAPEDRGRTAIAHAPPREEPAAPAGPPAKRAPSEAERGIPSSPVPARSESAERAVADRAPADEPKGEPGSSPGRRPAQAGVRNEEQEDLPKRGLTPAWGSRAIWWSKSGKHILTATRTGQHFRDRALDYELWVAKPAGRTPPEHFTRRAEHPGDGAYRETVTRWTTGARLLGRGRFRQLPAFVHVLDRQPGAVLFERYVHHGYGNTLAFIDWDGALRWTLRLEDLFTGEERAKFPDLDHSILWSWNGLGCWVSERRGTVFLLSVQGAFVEVALDTGVAKRTDAAALIDVIRDPGRVESRLRALRAVAPHRPDGFVPMLKELANGGPEELAAAARELLARGDLAAWIGRLGGAAEAMPALREEIARKWGRDALPELDRIAGDSAAKRVVRLRALHLRDRIDPAADRPLDGLADLLSDGVLWWRSDPGLEQWCEDRIVPLGDAAVAALLEKIGNEATPLQARREATRVLARIRTERSFAALVSLCSDADNIITWHARAGITAFPKKGLAARFEALLLQGSPADAAIAEYLGANPNPRVVVALIRAMERHPDDAALRGALGYAVQRCSGQWIPQRDDPAAWRHKLGH